MKLAERLPAWILCLALVVACADRPRDIEGTVEDDHAHPDRLSLSAEAYEAAGIAVAAVGLHAAVPTIQVTGSLSYDERRMAVATARIGGRISEVVADYGQRVRAGDVLAWIDSPELGAAQAEYRRAVEHVAAAQDRVRPGASCCSRATRSAVASCCAARPTGKPPKRTARPRSRSCTSWGCPRPTSKRSRATRRGRPRVRGAGTDRRPRDRAGGRVRARGVGRRGAVHDRRPAVALAVPPGLREGPALGATRRRRVSSDLRVASRGALPRARSTSSVRCSTRTAGPSGPGP